MNRRFYKMSSISREDRAFRLRSFQKMLAELKSRVSKGRTTGHRALKARCKLQGAVFEQWKINTASFMFAAQIRGRFCCPWRIVIQDYGCWAFGEMKIWWWEILRGLDIYRSPFFAMFDNSQQWGDFNRVKYFFGK